MALAVAGTSKSPSLSGAQSLRVRAERLAIRQARDISFGRAVGAQSSHDTSLGRAFASVLSFVLGSRRLYRRGCLARHMQLFGYDDITMQEAMYKSIVIELPDGKEHVIDVRDRDTTGRIKTILNLELTIDERTMELETMDGVIMEDGDEMSKFEMKEGTKFRLKLKELPPGEKPLDFKEGLPVVIQTIASGKQSKIRFVLEDDMLCNDVKKMAWEKLSTMIPYIGDLGKHNYGLFLGSGKHERGGTYTWDRNDRLWEYTTVGENDLKPEVIITFASLHFYNGPRRQAQIDALESKE